MFAGTAARHLACKPVAPADAVIYIDALGFTAKTTSTSRPTHQIRGDWVFLAKVRQEILNSHDSHAIHLFYESTTILKSTSHHYCHFPSPTHST